MNLIRIHQPGQDRFSEWQACVAELDWHIHCRRQSAVAAFAKAVWLELSAPTVVEAVEGLCRPFDPSLNQEALWDVWFEIVRQLNGHEDCNEQEAA
jgi:hypothetical protein